MTIHDMFCSFCMSGGKGTTRPPPRRGGPTHLERGAYAPLVEDAPRATSLSEDSESVTAARSGCTRMPDSRRWVRNEWVGKGGVRPWKPTTPSRTVRGPGGKGIWRVLRRAAEQPPRMVCPLVAGEPRLKRNRASSGVLLRGLQHSLQLGNL